MSSPDTALRPQSSPAAAADGCLAVVNAGSSSIKFGVYAAGQGQAMLYRGKVDGLGVSPRLRAVSAEGETVIERSWAVAELDARAASLEVLLAARDLVAGKPIGGVGHRVAHGGVRFSAPVRIDDAVLGQLAELAPLAPLHQPHNLEPIEVIAEAAPNVPQVACFDTAFHHGQPPLAQLFGLPRRFTDAGVRRYGFHGLSYEYVAGRLGEIAPELSAGRVIIAHLGNGASLCALKAGHSVATTMGFSALDGLVMGTRCGALDPGVLIFLMDAYGMGAREIEDLVYRHSGLLGVSEVSSDMRALRASPEPTAAEAIALFVYRVVREIGSMAAALSGLDGLVFTGGIGENDVDARAEIARGCAWLGLTLDPERNAGGSGRISRDGSKVQVWVVPTDEEAMIARHTAAVLGAG